MNVFGGFLMLYILKDNLIYSTREKRWKFLEAILINL